MAYQRPSLAEIINRKTTDLDSRLQGLAAPMRRRVFNALLRASAAIEHGLYGFINWLSLQVVPAKADEEYLKLHADWNGVPRLGAEFSTGSVTVTGTGIVEAGSLLQRTDGVQYEVITEAVISGSSPVDVKCITAGQIGNITATSTLTFVVPVPGVQSTITASGGDVSGGADIESIDAWRARFQEKVQQPPHGGALNDYVQWAKEVPGVTRVWPKGNWLGAGTVGVFFVRDNDATLIPDAGEVETVQAYLDSVRPVTANVTAIAPVAAEQDLTISLSPNTSVVQAAVTAELADLFSREAEVEDGTGSGTMLISRIREAVSIAAGESDNAVTVPAGNITISVGEIATLGTITFASL